MTDEAKKSEKAVNEAIEAADELSDRVIDDPRDQWMEELSHQAQECLDRALDYGRQVLAVKGDSDAAEAKRRALEEQETNWSERSIAFNEALSEQLIRSSEKDANREKLLAGGGGGPPPGGKTEETQREEARKRGYDWARKDAAQRSTVELVLAEKWLAFDTFVRRYGPVPTRTDWGLPLSEGKHRAIEDELRRRMEGADRRGSPGDVQRHTQGVSSATSGVGRGPERSAAARRLLPTYRTERAVATELDSEELLDRLSATVEGAPSSEGVTKVVALTNELKTRARKN